MSEMQLEEEQDIYETVRAGITEGGTSFCMARHVLDALSDSGYIIVRADLVEPVILGDAVTREDTGCAGTTDATCSASAGTTSPASLEPVIDDALNKALTDFDEMLCAHGHEMHPSLHVLADYARGAQRPITDDALREAVEWADRQAAAYLATNQLYIAGILRTLINHAMKGQRG